MSDIRPGSNLSGSVNYMTMVFADPADSYRTKLPSDPCGYNWPAGLLHGKRVLIDTAPLVDLSTLAAQSELLT